ncbi:uncharacterized protein LOC127285266 [Leptopilina boulardi]|uniref:uncharacterized protein LOC127285266 n=1 Tax=Leptopilina boulardi TaxID=63433 RepID=UPI0021F5BB34|nr:uncharacterized protein LOC127285266 [Leptopilina boulardi]
MEAINSQGQIIGVLQAVEIVPDLEIKLEQDAYDHVAENGFLDYDHTKRIPSTNDVGALNLWTREATSCLISQYKKYRQSVGQTTKIRSLREMFEMISFEMQKYGFYFSAQKCENKWRVLERKYNNLVFRERLKKPGRMRHYGHWEHRRALDEIFNEKKRHMYLDESDFPPPSGSAKIAMLAKAAEAGNTGQSGKSTNSVSDSTSTGQKTSEDTENQISAVKSLLEQFLEDMKQQFTMIEKNNERRHKEEMMIRQTELEVQKRILKLKEQKLELKKSQIVAAVQKLGIDIKQLQ